MIIRLIHLFTITVFGALFAQVKADSTATFTGVESISGTSLMKHVQYLGSDLLEGRATGSTGGKTAASYIRNELNRFGLTPGAPGNRFYQPILMHGSISLPESQLRIFSSNELLLDLEFGTDYLLFKSGAQTFVPQPVPVVFVGYGIIAPEYDYNDYQSINVEGKIAAYLSGEPESDDSTYFNGAIPTIYSLPESKQRLAISRGAAGSILIPKTPRRVIAEWEKLSREFLFEDITLAYSVTGHLSVMIHPAIANALFQNAPMTLQEILQSDRIDEIASFPLAVDVSFKGEFIERDFFSSNVIGVVEGKDPELKKFFFNRFRPLRSSRCWPTG